MKDFSERFTEILDSTGLTAYKLAKEIGSSESVISSIKAGKTKPSFDFLLKLLSKYEAFDANYILSGTGSLLKKRGDTPTDLNIFREDSPGIKRSIAPKKGTDASLNASPTASPKDKTSKKESNFKDQISTIYNLGAPKVVTVNERKEENIIYVPVKARAGYLAGYGDPEYIQSLPSFRLPGLTNATYRMFETEGPSMAPNIISGDRLIGQWVNSLDEIRDNRVYVMVCRDGVVVKRVLNRITERGRMVFKSDTITHRKDYPTYEVDPTDVLEVWYVRLKLSSDLSEPAEVYHRIGDLEADMVEVKQFLSTIKKQLPGK
jgi:transcriptional regulator with XRE-family HTH domain